jgi:pyrroline-5-carboxylate reductase
MTTMEATLAGTTAQPAAAAPDGGPARPAGAAAALAGRRLALVGAGTMGNAIAGGLARGGVFPDADLRVVDRHAASAAALAARVPGAQVADAAAACADAHVVLLCVKPKDVPDVLAQLVAAGALAHAPLVVSIAAGVSIAAIEAAVAAAADGRVPVIRAMPNTASAIGKGCTVLSAGAHATRPTSRRRARSSSAWAPASSSTSGTSTP